MPVADPLQCHYASQNAACDRAGHPPGLKPEKSFAFGETDGQRRNACDQKQIMRPVHACQSGQVSALLAQHPRCCCDIGDDRGRSEEHTSELQSLMRISYAVFCLKKKTKAHTK